MPTNSKNTVAFTVHPDVGAFIELAAKKADVERSVFVRRAVVKEAARVLRKPAPDVPEPRRGRLSEIKIAADKAGIPVQEFMRRAALKSLGIDPGPIKDKAPDKPKGKK